MYKGGKLIVDIDGLATAPPGSKPCVYRVKEVRVPEILTAFPLRVALLEARQWMLADTVDFIDDPEAPEEIVEEQGDDMVDDEAEAPYDGSQALVCIPRGSRVYIPRVGPRPVPKVPPLNDALEIEFGQVNPKRAPSASHDFYLHEIYKTATTVGEARRLGATTGHVRYDVKKGCARLVVAPAVVVFGAAAGPLVETWFD